MWLDDRIGACDPSTPQNCEAWLVFPTAIKGMRAASRRRGYGAIIATVLLLPVGSYEVYDDVYVNLKLPGHPDDIRGMPNLPFTVDSNRESDGISSTNPFTTTSASFPLYSSSQNYATYGITTEEELQNRKYHHAALVENQKLQGLAGPFAGEAEREAAAYNRLVELGDSPWNSSGLPSVAFPVDS